MKATLIDRMGSDLTVVNSARVSFGKHVDKFTDRDAKLITYLAEHGHTSPFRHPQAMFHVKAPLFVARQLGKHQVGMSWNEISRRYVDEPPEFYHPDKFRKRAQDKKQGSSEETTEIASWTGICNSHRGPVSFDEFYETVNGLYVGLLENDVAPEQARMFLPQNTYTEWYWTGSLLAWAHVCNLRCKDDTQEETRMLAQQIDDEMAKVFPHSWKALRDG